MGKKIQYKGINHLAMVTADMDGTIRFWRDFLDIRKRPQMLDPQPARTALEGSEPQPGGWAEPMPNPAEMDRSIYPGEGKIFANLKFEKEPRP